MDKFEKEMNDREDVEAIKRMASIRKDKRRLNKALDAVKKEMQEAQQTTQAVESMGLRRSSSPRKKR